MKEFINNILAFLFPFQELNDKPSIFVSETWLEKTMRPTQVLDYLWHPSKE